MPTTRLYLSLAPESLIASMLNPEEFGSYLAIGSTARTRGQAMFFEIDPALSVSAFPLHLVEEQCVARPDGRPKNSLYLSIYRTLEHIPMSAIGDLYLVTDDGKVLRLKRDSYESEEARILHLYQEFCPVQPTVASSLDAVEFCRFITSPERPVNIPRIVFSELIIRELANSPETGATGELPYHNIGHLRACLTEIHKNPEKKNKMVFRSREQDTFFRTIRNGFFVGDQKDLYYYPMPSQEELEGKYYEWWRSAQVTRSK